MARHRSGASVGVGWVGSSAWPGGTLLSFFGSVRCWVGTNVTGRYIAGTFWRFWGDPAKREKSFWVRRHPDKCIRITLANHDYDFAMVEVDDPAAEIARIEAWLHEDLPPMRST
jgi:hypothetical protein